MKKMKCCEICFRVDLDPIRKFQNPACSIGNAIDDVDFGGGSVLDLMLQPNLEPEVDKKGGDNDD
jgi:hypothetical protein